MLACAETHLREQERNTDKLADARVKTRRVTGLGRGVRSGSDETTNALP
ncbi:MAG: hypothetical protein QME59_06355 [Candidatus Hydrothermarchaeota archaeon]|nr:hypothetical protein [Candidatus Hydrothermarchaeota archaeon]